MFEQDQFKIPCFGIGRFKDKTFSTFHLVFHNLLDIDLFSDIQEIGMTDKVHAG